MVGRTAVRGTGSGGVGSVEGGDGMMVGMGGGGSEIDGTDKQFLVNGILITDGILNANR
jgi:hypothetical protein